MALGIEMLLQAGAAAAEPEARRALDETISSGRALEMLIRVVAAQGGDPSAVEDPSMLPVAPRTHAVEAERSGTVAACDARRVGTAAMHLGAGRERKEDTIDPAVGITVVAKPGEDVSAGDPVLLLRYRDSARLENALAALSGAIEISETPFTPPPLVAERIAR